MKKKILFYGNCQLGVISEYFLNDPKLNEIFEVILCDESCAPIHIWRGDKSKFAVWTNENRPIQKEIFNIVHEKLKQADIFVFQATERTCIDELKTQYLCDQVSAAKNVCIPNIRMFIYCSDMNALTPIFNYIRTKVSDPTDASQIAEYLRNSDDPQLTVLLEEEYPMSDTYHPYRNQNVHRAIEDAKNYSLYVNMEDYIRSNYKTKILTVSHNHMSRPYYAELLRRLLNILEVEDIEIDEARLNYPGPNPSNINPFEFKFFKEYFKELNENEIIPAKYPLEYVLEDYI
jgi:hypothetical protein